MARDSEVQKQRFKHDAMEGGEQRLRCDLFSFSGPTSFISSTVGLLCRSRCYRNHSGLISGPTCLNYVTFTQGYHVLINEVELSLSLINQVGLDFSDSAYFWLVVAVVCSGSYALHCRLFVLYEHTGMNTILLTCRHHHLPLISIPNLTERTKP